MGGCCSKPSRSVWYDKLPQGLPNNHAVLDWKNTMDNTGIGLQGVLYRISDTAQNVTYNGDKFYVESDELLYQCENMARVYELTSHPNLAQLHAAYREVDTEDTKESVTFIRTYCEGPDLLDRIVRLEAIVEAHSAQYTKQILSAVQHLHENGIVHRNIKPENINFKDKRYTELVLQLSVYNSLPGEKAGLSERCGTLQYAAPEVLKDNTSYGVAADLWSVGVVVYVMLSGYPPFSAESNTGMISVIKSGKYSFDTAHWDGVSDLAVEFISKLLRVDPRKRLNCEQALQHPWIVKYN